MGAHLFLTQHTMTTNLPTRIKVDLFGKICSPWIKICSGLATLWKFTYKPPASIILRASPVAKPLKQLTKIKAVKELIAHFRWWNIWTPKLYLSRTSQVSTKGSIRMPSRITTIRRPHPVMLRLGHCNGRKHQCTFWPNLNLPLQQNETIKTATVNTFAHKMMCFTTERNHLTRPRRNTAIPPWVNKVTCSARCFCARLASGSFLWAFIIVRNSPSVKNVSSFRRFSTSESWIRMKNCKINNFWKFQYDIQGTHQCETIVNPADRSNQKQLT